MWVGTLLPAEHKDILLYISLEEPGPCPKAVLLFLDCSSLVSAFPPSRSLITETCSRASIAARLRSEDGLGASLVAQWLRICLPMQGTRVRALVWEDSTCRGATGPVSHNYWAWASGACTPQQERPREWEARAPRWRVAPTRRNWRKPSHRNEDPTQPKIKIINK